VLGLLPIDLDGTRIDALAGQGLQVGLNAAANLPLDEELGIGKS